MSRGALLCVAALVACLVAVNADVRAPGAPPPTPGAPTAALAAAPARIALAARGCVADMRPCSPPTAPRAAVWPPPHDCPQVCPNQSPKYSMMGANFDVSALMRTGDTPDYTVTDGDIPCTPNVEQNCECCCPVEPGLRTAAWRRGLVPLPCPCVVPRCPSAVHRARLRWLVLTCRCCTCQRCSPLCPVAVTYVFDVCAPVTGNNKPSFCNGINSPALQYDPTANPPVVRRVRWALRASMRASAAVYVWWLALTFPPPSPHATMYL